MPKKQNFYRDLNKILIDVFNAGKDKQPVQPVLDIAHNRINQLLDEIELTRLQQVAGAAEEDRAANEVH